MPAGLASKVLFLDCPSGAAGDMIVAALLDLGLELSIVEETVRSLGVPGIRLSAQKVEVGSIAATRFIVEAEGPQVERPYRDIVTLIQNSTLDERTRALSLRIFETLGRAEARVHGVALDEVHFHEVGAIDSIVDIVGAAALFTRLGARVMASPLPLGKGHVETRHGTVPLPAPATLLCLTGVPTYASGLETELVTPTGAAIIKVVADEFMSWPEMRPLGVGYGAGTRALPDRPNALRAVLGTMDAPFDGDLVSSAQDVVLLEANIDDSSSEVMGYALEKALQAGALDAWLTPIVMKKSRPGFLFSVLARPEEKENLARVLLLETSTIGVRERRMARYVLPRRTEILESSWGPVRFKVSGSPPMTVKPEFEDAAAIAQRENIPLRVVLTRLTELGWSLMKQTAPS